MRKKRIKRRVKKGVWANLGYLIVGLIYLAYWIIRSFDNLFVKVFNLLPRWSRACIIWALVISNIVHNFDVGFAIKQIEVSAKQIVANELAKNTTTSDFDNRIDTKDNSKGNCTREHETACKIEKKGKELGLSEEQIKISIAISKWETGSWNSKIYKNYNNVGGMYCKGFIKYQSLDEGVNAFVLNLKRNYFDIGLNTIEKIGAKYCPVGAKNDPTGINKNWVPGVTNFYNQMKGSE